MRRPQYTEQFQVRYCYYTMSMSRRNYLIKKKSKLWRKFAFNIGLAVLYCCWSTMNEMRSIHVFKLKVFLFLPSNLYKYHRHGMHSSANHYFGVFALGAVDVVQTTTATSTSTNQYVYVETPPVDSFGTRETDDFE